MIKTTRMLKSRMYATVFGRLNAKSRIWLPVPRVPTTTLDKKERKSYYLVRTICDWGIESPFGQLYVVKFSFCYLLSAV